MGTTKKEMFVGQQLKSRLPTSATKTRLYFEVHLTLDPTRLAKDYEHRQLLTAIATERNWRVADFILLNEGTHREPKAFISARFNGFVMAWQEASRMVSILQRQGFIVLRYKVENTLIDSNAGGDPLNLKVGPEHKLVLVEVEQNALSNTES